MLLVPCFLILTPITADEALDIDSILYNENEDSKFPDRPSTAPSLTLPTPLFLSSKKGKSF